MKMNHILKEHLGWGIFHEDLFRDSFKFMNKHFGNKPLVGIEIGTYKGINAKQILKNMNIKRLYLIDSWQNYKDYQEYKDENLSNKFFQAMFRLRDYSDKTVILKDYSSNAVDKIKEQVDFVYIDGNHTYEAVKEDLNNYIRLIKPNGVLAGHDINFDGVLQAIIEFASKYNLKVYTKSKDWWIIKN